jgi:hypothetical protein
MRVTGGQPMLLGVACTIVVSRRGPWKNPADGSTASTPPLLRFGPLGARTLHYTGCVPK